MCRAGSLHLAAGRAEDCIDSQLLRAGEDGHVARIAVTRLNLQIALLRARHHRRIGNWDLTNVEAATKLCAANIHTQG